MVSIFTIPKAGTHFINSLMENLRIPIYAYHHTIESMPSQSIGNKNVVVIRDLRDVVCAVPFWINQIAQGLMENHPYMNPAVNSSYLAKTEKEKLLQCISIEGLPVGHMVHTQKSCQFVIEMMKRDDTFVLRFEDLIGDSAGGTLPESERIDLFQKVCKHIGHPRSGGAIKKALADIWGTSLSYNPIVKKVHRWEALFDDKHKEIFIKIWDQMNVDLGYPSLANQESDEKIA